MSNRYPNPVRGAISCPVCSSASTVHQVGEGQLLATGEPTKNARNLGLFYYRCTECGNSSISKKVNDWIIENKVDSTDLLKRNEQDANLNQDIGSVLTENEDELTVEKKTSQTNNDKVQSTNSTVRENRGSLMNYLFITLGVFLLLIWVLRELKPIAKNKLTEDSNGELQHG
ncbi:hypothetical protein AB2S62_21770 [Vibrio sp. NTOU-M3]|uniref:hypothetical protein n=1 Tax=Vibrio sp. NTOU-M3 TaxID=3234954 RepID=UPI00349FBE8B